MPGVGQTYRLDVRGEFLRSFDQVRRHLRLTAARKTLITGINDPCVLGALRAFEEAGISELCAAVSFGAIPAARAELRAPGTRLIGSVAFFPERYGEPLIRLALAVLNRKRIPPAVYAEFQMITPQNVNQLYSMDDPIACLDFSIR